MRTEPPVSVRANAHALPTDTAAPRRFRRDPSLAAVVRIGGAVVGLMPSRKGELVMCCAR